LDTINFNELSTDDYKKQINFNWSNDPCGSNYSEKEKFCKEYFEDIEHHRYESHPWILEKIKSLEIRNKQVLEIGFGMGTDHLSLARQGGIVHGIDYTPKSIEITKKRFELYGFKSRLLIGDVEHLPYQDGIFDFVYSFGVIHHTFDMNKAISEIYRVLKPGGSCWITVYNKNSIFFWWTIFIVNFLIKGGWKKRSIKQQISLVEYPGSNENLIVNLYKEKEIIKLFGKYAEKYCEIKHLIPIDIAIINRCFKNPNTPSSLLSILGNKFGWYVAVTARK
jgi:ubiquinone/menaquinone biosynthesis C-methylase UbiE